MTLFEIDEQVELLNSTGDGKKYYWIQYGNGTFELYDECGNWAAGAPDIDMFYDALGGIYDAINDKIWHRIWG